MDGDTRGIIHLTDALLFATIIHSEYQKEKNNGFETNCFSRNTPLYVVGEM
jgi:hypothetical protein